MTNSAGGCHYLPSGLWLLTLPCRAPPPFGQYQITLSGYKGTCVCEQHALSCYMKQYLYNWCKCNEDNVSNNETEMLHSKSIKHQNINTFCYGISQYSYNMSKKIYTVATSIRSRPRPTVQIFMKCQVIHNSSVLPHRMQVKHGRLQLSKFDSSYSDSPDVTLLVVATFTLHSGNFGSHPDQRTCHDDDVQ